MQYTAKRVNAKFVKTKVLPVASRRLFQNVMARRRFYYATIITKPSMNPTEKEVENRFKLKAPIIAIESWTITVQTAARIRASEASCLCKLMTIFTMFPYQNIK